MFLNDCWWYCEVNKAFQKANKNLILNRDFILSLSLILSFFISLSLLSLHFCTAFAKFTLHMQHVCFFPVCSVHLLLAAFIYYLQCSFTVHSVHLQSVVFTSNSSWALSEQMQLPFSFMSSYEKYSTDI